MEVVNTWWEGPVPRPWDRASYEMFQVEHGVFGGDVPRPYWKCSLWNTSMEVARMMRPGWPGDGAPSLESLRELRLRALLNDLVKDLGQAKAAEELVLVPDRFVRR